MAIKACPKCGKEYGVRKLVCDCGHDFACKRGSKTVDSHPLYPEPGGWVVDGTKGMPKIEPPELLSCGQIDTATIKEIIAYEGLGYTLHSYIPADRIVDSELRKLWCEARRAMLRVIDYLEGVESDR